MGSWTIRVSTMLRHVFFTAILIICLPSWASEFAVGTNAIRSVYDGDSFNVAFRLAHIDTPEIKGKCEQEKSLAIKARDFVRHYFKSNKKINIKVVTVGKYGRPIVEVRGETGYLNQMLLDNGLARPYEGNKKSWCL